MRSLSRLGAAFLLVTSLAFGQATLTPAPKFHADDGNGLPLSGGKLCSYQAGTSTPVATKTTAAGSVSNTNPVILDARGEGDVWLTDSQSYKLVLRDATGADSTCATGAVIWTIDNIRSATGAVANALSVVIYRAADYSGDKLQGACAALVTGQILYIPASTTVTETAGCAIASKNLTFRGADAQTSIIQDSGSAGGTMFLGSGTVKRLDIDNLTIDCGGASGALYGLDVPDFGGANDWSNGQFQIRNSRVINCSRASAIAIRLGTSVYTTLIDNVQFVNNRQSFKSKSFDDFRITRSQFQYPVGNSAQVEFMGGSKHDIAFNDFECNSTCGSGPDILIDADGTSAAGFGDIGPGNKFGPEGESASRSKIKIVSQTSVVGNTVYGLNIHDNDFSSVGGAVAITGYAIDIQNPVVQMRVTGNNFRGFPTQINDAQNQYSGGEAAQSVFGCDNVIAWNGAASPSATNSQVKIFTNTGRDFGTICDLFTADPTLPVNRSPRQMETPELRNRLTYSEDFTQWTKLAGTETVTCGQTDPYGTTRACNITVPGNTAAEGVYLAIDTTGARASGFVIKCQGLAGTLSTLRSGVFDVTAGAFISGIPFVTLGPDWNTLKYVVRGINTGHTFRQYIYPGTSNAVESGTVRVFGCQASDYDSDYYPTAGSVLSSTTSGFRLIRKAMFAGGVSIDASVGADGGGFKHKRVTTGSVGAGTSAGVTLTWTTAFADANYTPVCAVVDGTTSAVTIRLHHVESVAAASIIVRVLNDDGAGAHTGTVDCIAVHD